MVDIHHHLLWGLDDGAKDFETSVKMARLAADDGITHVVCTPHANSNYTFNPELNRAKLEELKARLEAEQIPLTLGLGSDFHVNYENIEEARADKTKFSINGLGYLMVELPDFGLPKGLTDIFYDLRVAGMTPVLTHPERNPTLVANNDRMLEWMRGGLLVQVTADSVTGQMGKKAEKMAWTLLEKRWVHFIASDAHGLTGRPPRMRAAANLVAKKYGAQYAESLVTTNPMAAFHGKSFRPVEEPLGLEEETKRPGIFQRLFGR
ncbi:protein-tyrosine phosphatase [Granulicella rosea]|uniref:protein-tyrosine-phosphatase n=1 Tax=Granulicella rosea TaxID=474952 RepID=A0A239HWH0_9BACT|nr:CpsB/CapC family capsule biosynthesis tyrosine phosphatase [Granulicella rosea]SNS85591.1 protein-tyrosine phosphatase [Granulicella rosea]